MTAKEYLMQAWRIEDRIESRIEERERLEARLTSPRGSNLTGMPRGGNSDWTNAVIAVSELNATINAEIVELCRVKRQVNNAIEAVEDSRYRRVLELRYRNYMAWDDIAKQMGYTLRNVFELHGKALLKIKQPKR